MRAAFVALFVVGCSTSGAPADAGPDVCNHYLPDATIYDCEAGATVGCAGDPSGGAGGGTYPVGCNATTTRPSGMDINCNTASMCNCHPLTCTCTQASPLDPDAGLIWVCPD